MSISRRKFIEVGAVTLVAAGIPMSLVMGQESRGTSPGVFGPGGIPYASQQDPVFYFTKESFTPYVNSVFQFNDGNGLRSNFTLLAVDEYLPELPKGFVPEVPTRTFSLYFTGGRRFWPQGTYRISHAALGEFSLLVVPIVSRDQQIYQAVISHLT